MKLYNNLISSITTHEKACSYNLFLKYFYLSFFSIIIDMVHRNIYDCISRL